HYGPNLQAVRTDDRRVDHHLALPSADARTGALVASASRRTRIERTFLPLVQHGIAPLPRLVRTHIADALPAARNRCRRLCGCIDSDGTAGVENAAGLH